MADEFIVLSICRGNIHRSALSEALLKTWAAWYLPPSLAEHVRSTSAGVIAPAGAAMGRRNSLLDFMSWTEHRMTWTRAMFSAE